MKVLRAVDIYIFMLYATTAIYYSIIGGFDLALSLPIPSGKLYLIPCGLAEILMFDLIGIFLWFKIGGLKSLGFVLFIGSLQLTTWAMTQTFTYNFALTAAQIHHPSILIDMVVFLTATPILFLLLWKRVDWRLNLLFFVFPIYYIFYFLTLGGPYVPGSNHQTIWELLYQASLNLAMVSGFFWRSKK